MIVTTPCYEVRCDEPGCGITTGDLPGSDYSGWGDPGTAQEDWEASDGIILDDGRAFCEEHSLGKSCDWCDHKGTDVAEVGDDGKPSWDLCPDCAKPVTA